MSTSGKEYEALKLKGPINVVPVTPEELKGEYVSVYLLMGPTGSGKSAYIQSLSPNQNLEISKDSLESVTQQVVCYRVVNLTHEGWAVLLVDTPGFLDIKLSESRITANITDILDRIRQSARYVTASIFYFQPITDIWLAGSKRHAVKLLRAFAQSFGGHSIYVITTMWNHISTPKQINDANHRFTSLKNDIFVTSDGLSIDITKFEFSRDSALSILESGNCGWNHTVNKSQKMDLQYQTLFLKNLVDRINNTQLQLQNLANDKQNVTTPGIEDPLLLEVILSDEKAALDALEAFAYDLCVFDPTIYQTVFPGVPFPPHPSLPKTQSRLLAKFHRAVPFKKVFGRRK